MTDAINLRQNAVAAVEAPYQPAYTGVRIYVGKDDNNTDLYYSAGNTTGSVLEIENPWGTQAMANTILATISGYSYKPMEATGALLDPAAEMGDAVAVNGITSVIAQRDTKFGALLVSNISAPSDGELGHEYQYEQKQNRQVQREIAQANSSLIVELDEIKGQVTDDEGNYTVVTIKSDGLYVGGASAKLDGSNLKNGSVDTTQIAGGAITTAKIDAEAVTAAKIKSGTITADEIKARTITSSEIATGTITANEIASNTITAAELRLRGMINFYASSGTSTYAQLGYGTGQDGSGSSTYGAKLVATGGSNYIIVTNAGARMTAGSGYIYTANNTCHCSSAFVADSDARIKTDVDDDMESYKQVLMNLRPVSFEYIPERGMGDKRYTGFIAQEAEEVVDEFDLNNWALASINGEGMHGICYEALIPVLVACVQDQAREIAELKERING